MSRDATKAHVEWDPARMGVKVAVRRPGYVLTWSDPGTRPLVEGYAETPDDVWLHLQEDDARAIYEALAEHFGFGTHNTEALRRDYLAERARVDRLIEYATAPPIIVNGDRA